MPLFTRCALLLLFLRRWLRLRVWFIPWPGAGILDSDSLVVSPFSRSLGAVFLESFSCSDSELLALLLLVELLEADLAVFFFDEDEGFSSSESELPDDDDPEEEVSSLSESLLVDMAELVSDSMNGLYA